MFTRFVAIVGTVALLFIIGGFFLPRYVHVERSIEINRPAPPVFALVNSYSTFASWSPWAERDPDAVYEFSGPEAGVGARMTWSGDPRLVGSGWQEIIESVPHSLVRTRLFFDQQGSAVSYFQLDETGNGVLVTWGFDTDLMEDQGFFGGVMARYFGLLFDRWIGTDYEDGLARLKAYAESLPVPEAVPAEIGVVQVEPVDIVYLPVSDVRFSQGQTEGDVTAALTVAFQQLMQFISEQNLQQSGQPMTMNQMGGPRGYELMAAIPVNQVPQLPESPIVAGQSPAGKAVRMVHRGSYDEMASSYRKLQAYMEVHELQQGAWSWEQYISDPAFTPEDDWITHIYVMVE